MTLSNRNSTVQKLLNDMIEKDIKLNELQWPVGEEMYIDNALTWRPQLTAIAIYRMQKKEVQKNGSYIINPREHECIGGQCTFRELHFDVYKFIVCKDDHCSLCGNVPIKEGKRLVPFTQSEYYWKTQQFAWRSFKRKHKIHKLFHVQNIFMCNQSGLCHVCDENCEQLEEKTEGVYICTMSGLEKNSVRCAWQERKRQSSISDEIVHDIKVNNTKYKENLDNHLGRSKKPPVVSGEIPVTGPLKLFGVETDPMTVLPLGFEEWYDKDKRVLICPEINANKEEKENSRKVQQIRLNRESENRFSKRDGGIDITTGCRKGLYNDYYPGFSKSLSLLERNFPKTLERRKRIIQLVSQYKTILLNCVQMFLYRILFSQERMRNDIEQNDLKVNQLKQHIIKHIKLCRRNKTPLFVHSLRVMAMHFWERNINKTPWNPATPQVKEIILSYYSRKLLNVWFNLIINTHIGLSSPSKLKLIPTCLALFCLCRCGLVQRTLNGDTVIILPIDTAAVSYLPPSEQFSKYNIQKRDINSKQLYIKHILENEATQKDSQIYTFEGDHRTLMEILHKTEMDNEN